MNRQDRVHDNREQSENDADDFDGPSSPIWSALPLTVGAFGVGLWCLARGDWAWGALLLLLAVLFGTGSLIDRGLIRSRQVEADK